MQATLFPVICNRSLPPPSTAAADFIGVDAATTHRWLCKGQSRHAMVPVTEWLCSRLAMQCGLPVPPIAVVELAAQPGVQYFGSQWQGGEIDFINANGNISNPEVFLKTHAVDLFVHNTDRHPGNFLYLKLAGEIVARVIDFSHSLTVMGWPLPSLPMTPCHTTNYLPLMLSQSRIAQSAPIAILDVVRQLPDTWMRDELEAMPQQWASRELQIQLREWWVGRGRQNRVDAAQSCLP